MAPILNLGLVSANSFSLNIRQLNIEVFSITLDSLDYIVEDWRQELGAVPDIQTEESLQEKILAAYHYILDF